MAEHWRRTAVLQAAKAAVAAVLAWLIAAEWWGLPQPFLAPYAAVFLVEATVYRSLFSALQQVGAVVLGVVLAALAIQVLPWQTVALGLVVLVGLLVGRWRGFGASGVWVGVTALLLVSYGSADDSMLMLDRVGETVLGAAIGVAINALVFPPVYTRGTEAATKALAAELADVLCDIAATLRESSVPRSTPSWVARARNTEQLLRRAEEASGWGTESVRFNARSGSGGKVANAARWHDLMVLLRAAWPHVRELTEALDHAVRDDDAYRYPSEEVRERLAALLEVTARLSRARAEGEKLSPLVEEGREAMNALERDLVSGEGLNLTIGLAGVLLPAKKTFEQFAV
ncbi:FUSC family protein [Amycolatopsis sp. 195334CR]|uniref:FUSC family protein n=1 Tax=Amycolatopsis sp. 195334CR TaxID=2814588 RepID=UPI001A90B103|nr:FUSC family protein [Amycolatopsis sp. 195334CR]MBN6041344.1 FUSC family protein [Amycolatopsis sp. 195334CR]